MASTSKPQGMAVAGCNYVAQDQIWKDHVGQEQVAARAWPDNWAFLKTKHVDVLEKGSVPPSREKKPKLEPLMQALPVTPLHERVTVYPTDKPVPRTTSGEVGWRSTEPKLRLEKYGSYSRPKGCLLKTFNWPLEAMD